MARIQIITLFVNLLFLAYIARLIKRGRLREEYSIVWLIGTFILILFTLWRDGLEVITHLFGIIDPPNLIFTACIFIILIYLLHLSVVNSKLQKNISNLTQELALIKEKAATTLKKDDQPL